MEERFPFDSLIADARNEIAFHALDLTAQFALALTSRANFLWINSKLKHDKRFERFGFAVGALGSLHYLDWLIFEIIPSWPRFVPTQILDGSLSHFSGESSRVFSQGILTGRVIVSSMLLFERSVTRNLVVRTVEIFSQRLHSQRTEDSFPFRLGCFGTVEAVNYYQEIGFSLQDGLHLQNFASGLVRAADPLPVLTLPKVASVYLADLDALSTVLFIRAFVNASIPILKYLVDHKYLEFQKDSPSVAITTSPGVFERAVDVATRFALDRPGLFPNKAEPVERLLSFLYDIKFDINKITTPHFDRALVTDMDRDLIMKVIKKYNRVVLDCTQDPETLGNLLFQGPPTCTEHLELFQICLNLHPSVFSYITYDIFAFLSDSIPYLANKEETNDLSPLIECFKVFAKSHMIHFDMFTRLYYSGNLFNSRADFKKLYLYLASVLDIPEHPFMDWITSDYLSKFDKRFLLDHFVENFPSKVSSVSLEAILNRLGDESLGFVAVILGNPKVNFTLSSTAAMKLSKILHDPQHSKIADQIISALKGSGRVGNIPDNIQDLYASEEAPESMKAPSIHPFEVYDVVEFAALHLSNRGNARYTGEAFVEALEAAISGGAALSPESIDKLLQKIEVPKVIGFSQDLITCVELFIRHGAVMSSHTLLQSLKFDFDEVHRFFADRCAYDDDVGIEAIRLATQGSVHALEFLRTTKVLFSSQRIFDCLLDFVVKEGQRASAMPPKETYKANLKESLARPPVKIGSESELSSLAPFDSSKTSPVSPTPTVTLFSETSSSANPGSTSKKLRKAVNHQFSFGSSDSTSSPSFSLGTTSQSTGVSSSAGMANTSYPSSFSFSSTFGSAQPSTTASPAAASSSLSSTNFTFGLPTQTASGFSFAFSAPSSSSSPAMSSTNPFSSTASSSQGFSFSFTFSSDSKETDTDKK